MTITWTPDERTRAERAYQAARETMLVASEALASLPEAQRARIQLAAGAEGLALVRAGQELQEENLAQDQADALRQINAAHNFRQLFAGLGAILRERGATAEDRQALMDAGWRHAGQRLADADDDWRQIPGAIVRRIPRKKKKKYLGLILGLGAAYLLLRGKDD